MHLLKAKLMSVVQAKLTISNINQTVPHAARLGAKERSSRALQGKAAVALETWN